MTHRTKGNYQVEKNYSKTSGDGDLPKGDKAVFLVLPFTV
mgnify:CR=1 FL=1